MNVPFFIVVGHAQEQQKYLGIWSDSVDEKTCKIPVGASPVDAMVYKFTTKNVFYYEIECSIQKKTLHENEADLNLNCNKAGHIQWSEKITMRILDSNRMSLKSWGTIPKDTPGGHIDDEIVYRCPRVGIFAAGPSEGSVVASVAWKDCQSSDTDRRLGGCTKTIDAHGFGSEYKLADALDARCWAYNAKERFDLAISDCEASIRLRPKYSYAYNNLGTAYLGVGDYKKALVAFNHAIELKSDFYWSRLNRAKTFIALGQREQAIKDYEYLLARDPNNQEILNTLSGLKSGAANILNVMPSGSDAQETIMLEQNGGVYVVSVRFNDAITLEAVVDSGASDVSVPADVVLTLMRTKTVSQRDFLGQQTYVLADGSKVPSQQFLIRTLKVGNKTVENVVASIASVNGTILLGQSFLRKFKSWSVDNERHSLILK